MLSALFVNSNNRSHHIAVSCMIKSADYVQCPGGLCVHHKPRYSVLVQAVDLGAPRVLEAATLVHDLLPLGKERQLADFVREEDPRCPGPRVHITRRGPRRRNAIHSVSFVYPSGSKTTLAKRKGSQKPPIHQRRYSSSTTHSNSPRTARHPTSHVG